MTIPFSKRIKEIQRLKVLAELLEIIGAIEDDDLSTKDDIKVRIIEVINNNHLYESPSIYPIENLVDK